MAEKFGFNDQYDGNEYFRYKSREREALRTLVGSDNYKQWSVREIYRAAEQAVSLLSKGDLNIVINHLQKSTTSRRKFSLRFRFAPKNSQIQHAHWQDMIERISKLAQQNIADVIAHDQYRQEKLTLLDEHKDSEQCPGGHLTAEQEQVEELEDSILSVDEAIFLRFLEEIELCVTQAEASWKRVALTELDLSTAAILTSTYIRTIRSMITAETLLSSSWFERDCVTKSLSGLDSTYWTELEACAKSIGEIYMHMASPVFESGMPRCHAPTLTQLLTELKDPRTCKTIFDTPLIIAVAASLVCRFQNLTIPTNSPSLQQLGLSVEEQIRSIEPILQRQLDVYKDNSTFRDISERTEKIRKWAGLCRDPVSLGHMMSWLRINRVLCIQLFIHDSSILQLFAYICERIRLRDKKVHLALEELLDDGRIAGFLYLDGRPKDLKECERGIRGGPIQQRF